MTKYRWKTPAGPVVDVPGDMVEALAKINDAFSAGDDRPVVTHWRRRSGDDWIATGRTAKGRSEADRARSEIREMLED